MVQQQTYWKVLTRRKIITNETGDGETKLNRILNLWDLTALGVGSTLGAGVYVLAGQIAKEQAGPSVMLSFAIAALASLLAGICYAEFGARVPKAGSAYVYSYVCIGEFAAFVIGWNLMLEYIIGTAAVGRGISIYLDTLINNELQNTFADIAPMHVSFFGSYFDFFAFALVLVFGVILAFGVETSKMANNFCTTLNLAILLFVIIAGSIKANFSNWTIDPATVHVKDANIGDGGFFPFGFAGTLKGAATCFFGFVGFDCIATTGEEVLNPRKNIPRSILLSLLIIFICYCGVSTVLTLMVPYYLQDANAPLPYAFKEVGWTFAMWIVSIGGLIGLLASLFGALFPLPRIMYSMAEDGLLFRFLGKVNPRFQVPVMGSIFAAVLTALIAGLFDLAQLVNLLSIGTLLAYSVVAISVTVIRYMDNDTNSNLGNGSSMQNNSNMTLSENSLLTSSGSRITGSSIVRQLFNFKRIDIPTSLSTRIVGTLITVFCLLSLGIGLIFMQAYDALIDGKIWVLVLLVILVILTLLVLLAICLQPREWRINTFRVPFVPIVPAISIFINIYLMLQLDESTWIRFGIWMALGIPIFIACWCMYDNKNLAKRNPERVAFEKALKENAPQHKPRSNGHLTIATVEASTVKMAANGSTTMLQQTNQNSIKSLDEIMNLNEVGEDLIEKKYPNGKIFFVQDTKDNKSNGSTSSTENGARAYETSEEEKSVIAMLDDVLQAEDDNTLPTPNIIDYSRKFSVDSEMFPSVIESTTVATVHSSSDSSEKDGLEDLPETDGEHSSNASLNGDFIYKEITDVAIKFIDELLASEAFLLELDKRKILLQPELKPETLNPVLIANVSDSKATNFAALPVHNGMKKVPAKREHNKETLNRSASEASLMSEASIEDPLHSEKFKNKLSMILGQPPAPATHHSHKPVVETEHKGANASVTYASRPPFKQSKSETDLRLMVLKAIEGTGNKYEDDENAITTAPTKAVDGIPTPPKFDPILYKTINSLNRERQRPSLNKLLKEEVVEPKPSESEIENLRNEPEVPFKMKLNAILRRGPSHRSQQRPNSIEPKRVKSMGPLLSEESPILQARPAHKSYTAKSESNLTQTPDPATEINGIRKSLRHIQKGGAQLT